MRARFLSLCLLTSGRVLAAEAQAPSNANVGVEHEAPESQGVVDMEIEAKDAPKEESSVRSGKKGYNKPKARWRIPGSEDAKLNNDANEAKLAPRVRIGLRLTPFQKVVSKNKEGKAETHFVPVEPIRHTLRARLNKENHFFVGDFHVETKPKSWVRKTRRYEVRLNVSRRHGSYGQLEEPVGYVDVAGVLDEQEPNVFVLIGVGRARLRDQLQNPALDIVAGFAPSPEANKGPTISAKPETIKRGKGPSKEAPSTYDGELMQGRF